MLWVNLYIFSIRANSFSFRSLCTIFTLKMWFSFGYRIFTFWKLQWYCLQMAKAKHDVTYEIMSTQVFRIHFEWHRCMTSMGIIFCHQNLLFEMGQIQQKATWRRCEKKLQKQTDGKLNSARGLRKKHRQKKYIHRSCVIVILEYHNVILAAIPCHHYMLSTTVNGLYFPISFYLILYSHSHIIFVFR